MVSENASNSDIILYFSKRVTPTELPTLARKNCLLKEVPAEEKNVFFVREDSGKDGFGAWRYG